jgi:ribosomal protein S18 acetylase RimI-like enzyme
VSHVRIERLTDECADEVLLQIADIHRREISEGFLSTVGSNFLMKLYRCVAGSPHTFLLAAMSDGSVLGFVAGCADTSQFYKYFFKRAGISVLPMLLPKLLSVDRLKRITETLLYPRRKHNQGLPASEILNFCTCREFQGQGIGRTLFSALMEEFRSRGIEEIKIVTGAHQVSAQKFYEKLGAGLVKDIEVHRGAKSLVYLYRNKS